MKTQRATTCQRDAKEIICRTRFGGFCPYWAQVGGQVVAVDTAEEIISAYPEERRVIDVAAVLELFQFNYMLGDRTLVKGIRRMPWRAELRRDGSVSRYAPLSHSSQHLPPHEVAKRLRDLLTEELLGVVGSRSRVFLLLSGGLDSRVVAGVLKRMEPQLSAEIVCVTWGQTHSRDVCYARRIASWYDWGFEHIPYDSELVWSNVGRGAVWGGSEVAGLHLHGLEWFRRAKPGDLVIAASFGDSIGRAEFSSRHLSQLALVPIRNTGGVVHALLARQAIELARQDRQSAWRGAELAPDWARYELDMQENYMRRMICHAMDYVRQFCDLHQAFTSNDVVSYMWSLAPECRTDEIYQTLLRDLDPRLYSLPWARTGVALDGSVESDGSLRRDYHELGRWLRRDLRPRLEGLVFSGGLESLGVFHWPSVERLWRRFITERDDILGCAENVVKLCSIELTRRRFGLRACRQPTPGRDVLFDVVQHPVRRALDSGERIAAQVRRRLW